MWNQYKFDNIVETLYSVRNNENEWGYALKSCAEYISDVDIFLIEENKVTQKRQVFSSIYTGYRDDNALCQNFKLLFNDLIEVIKKSNDDILIFKTSIYPNLINEVDHFTQPYSITVHSVFCLPITTNNIDFIFCIILRSQNIEFSNKQLNNCQRFAFHIKTVIQQLISQKNLLSQRLLFFEIYNTLDIPVIISNHLGHIEFINSSAHKFLTDNDTNHVIKLDNIDFPYLQQVFLLRPINGIKDFYISDNLNFFVTEKNLINEFSSYTLILFLDIRLKENNEAINLIQNLYQLTKSELNLTMALLKGLSITDYSKDQCVSLNTSRTHLKSIFKKTKTNKQSELLSLLCRLITISCNFSD